MSQSHSASFFRVPAGSGATPTAMPMVLTAVSGGWELNAGTAPDAIAMNRGDGGYTITGLTDPAYSSTADALRFVSVRGGTTGY